MTGGIVCEYNPMHNGHIYHIEKTKAAGADFIVCVMSGNFVQRGECALIDKWQRAENAVRNGADVVIDLPVPWAMGSAESFARGSISLLSFFGIDMLSFGSETEKEELLQLCANAPENEKVISLLKKYMADGLNYPSALSKAVGEIFGEEAKKIISSPNSTLAAEYIKQLRKYSPECHILPIKRAGAQHDSDAPEGKFASASKIRTMLENEDVSHFVPDITAEMLSKNSQAGTVHRLKYAERAILSSLREMKKEDYSLYVTDDSGLVSRIHESVKNAESLDELYSLAKSKNYTHARVRREVLNLYLKIPKDISKQAPPYIRILAVSERGLSLLAGAKRKLAVPIVTKHSDMAASDSFGKQVYALQCATTDKFALMSEKVRKSGLEQKNSMKIVK
ncbi:MAG: nucleotidyltransferase family protein [Clostridia bacterium]|nr:nucleotidyltransferase family protein [Clostridia bacterium]